MHSVQYLLLWLSIYQVTIYVNRNDRWLFMSLEMSNINNDTRIAKNQIYLSDLEAIPNNMS